MKLETQLLEQEWLERLLNAYVEREQDNLPEEEKTLIDKMLAESELVQIVIQQNINTQIKDLDRWIEEAEQGLKVKRARHEA